MSAAERVGSWFVASAPHVERVRETAGPGWSVGLLAAGEPAGPLGAVLALGLAQAAGAPFAVVLDWGREAPSFGAAPAGPAVRRAARSFAARDVAAAARGRLLWVTLPMDEEAAVAAAVRALGTVSAGVPAVVTLGRPRTEAMDGLLADLDLVVVASGKDDLRGQAAACGVATVARQVVRWAQRPSPLLRRLAPAGIGLGAARLLPPEVRR